MVGGLALRLAETQRDSDASETSLETLSLKELKALCKQCGLPIGRHPSKLELITRLLDASGKRRRRSHT